LLGYAAFQYRDKPMPADLKTAKALGAESGNGHGCDGQNSRGLGKRSREFDEICEANEKHTARRTRGTLACAAAHANARAKAARAADLAAWAAAAATEADAAATEADEVRRQWLKEARTLVRNFADENKKLLQEKESLASESSGFREKLEHLEDGLKEDDAYLRSLRKKIKNDHDEHERILRGKDDEIARLKPHPCDRAAEAFRHPPSRERAARGAGPRARRGDGESACRGRAHRDGPTDGPAGRRERGAAAASAQRRAGASGGASVGAAASVGSMQQPQPGAPRPYVWVKLES